MILSFCVILYLAICLKKNVLDIIRYKMIGFDFIRDDVDNIINNGIVDKHYIEKTLDYLMEFCYDDVSYSYFYRLIDYYSHIDEMSAGFYLKFFKKYF